MGKLRVAVIMEDCQPTEGGGYSYYQTVLTAINAYKFHPDIEIVNLNVYKHQPGLLPADKIEILVQKNKVEALAYNFLNISYRILHRVLQNNSKVFLDSISKMMDLLINRSVFNVLEREKIDLIYYLKPKENLVNYPMVVTHWDVGHKSMYPFPEVAWNGNFEKKEKYYSEMLAKAFLILCESEAGARELQHYYRVNPNRVKVLPLFAGEVIKLDDPESDQLQILAGYQLTPGGYYLYPAQFWAHKNHHTLIHAFKSLLGNENNSSLKLVLCGGDQGNLSYIKQMIQSLDLTNNVLLPGFVPNKVLYALYRNAIALVMPTFLGPTNLPLIEAAQLRCAIICSDFEGHREILGNSALFIDPSCIQSIKAPMEQLLNKQVRQQLVDSAYHQITNSSFRVERSIPLLDRFLQQLKPVRKAWGIHMKFVLVVAKIGLLSFN